VALFSTLNGERAPDVRRVEVLVFRSRQNNGKTMAKVTPRAFCGRPQGGAGRAPAACVRTRQNRGKIDAKSFLEAGRKLAALGTHPRLAHMAVRAAEIGAPGLGCLLAAVLGERDVLSGTGHGSDLGLRLQALAGEGPCAGAAGVLAGCSQRALPP
jgi:hypothetical protein